MEITLPNPKDVLDTLSGLLGRDVEVQVADAWAPQPLDRAAAAEFVGEGLALKAIAMVDLPLGVFCGAAIGLIPAGGARAMIEDRDPSQMVLENLYEVLNVLTSVMNMPGNPHVKIGAMHEPGSVFPGDIAQVCARVYGRLDLTVSIDGYGSGRLALITA
jgi:hypothetical protein